MTSCHRFWLTLRWCSVQCQHFKNLKPLITTKTEKLITKSKKKNLKSTQTSPLKWQNCVCCSNKNIPESHSKWSNAADVQKPHSSKGDYHRAKVYSILTKRNQWNGQCCQNYQGWNFDIDSAKKHQILIGLALFTAPLHLTLAFNFHFFFFFFSFGNSWPLCTAGATSAAVTVTISGRKLSTAVTILNCSSQTGYTHFKVLSTQGLRRWWWWWWWLQ